MHHRQKRFSLQAYKNLIILYLNMLREHDERMDAVFSALINRKAHILGHQQSFKSSVMLPLIQREDDTYILFEVRSLKLKHQPGEICFPGGKFDAEDQSMEFTAKRELCEELGLEFDDVKTIAPLDILITPFRGIIYPYVGEIIRPEKIAPNEAEVSEIFYVPLTYLLNTHPETYTMNIHLEPDEQFPYQAIPNGDKYRKRSYKTVEYFYYYNDYVIWGLTAKILHHFLELIKKAEN